MDSVSFSLPRRLRLTALHGLNTLVCSRVQTRIPTALFYASPLSVQFFALPFPTVPSNSCLSHKKTCINEHFFLTKKNIYDVFDNFSLTHTFSIDVIANFLCKTSQKRYFFVSRAFILTNHFCAAYFEQMSRCVFIGKKIHA